MRRSDLGGVSILMAVVVVMAGAVMLQVARSGVAASRAARADTAADAAALAGAHALARNEGPGAAVSAARLSAAENGATFVRCLCSTDAAEVTVRVGRAVGRARAEVRQECRFRRCED